MGNRGGETQPLKGIGVPLLGLLHMQQELALNKLVSTRGHHTERSRGLSPLNFPL